MPEYPPIIKRNFAGLAINVESAAGTYRYWYDEHGKERGSTFMVYDYGEVAGTHGTDGDAVDVYLGPNPSSPWAFVVHQQKKPDFKEYDEDKVMLGFDTEEHAKVAYLLHYNDPRFFGSITKLTLESLKEKLSSMSGTFIKSRKSGIMQNSMKKALVLSTARDTSNTKYLRRCNELNKSGDVPAPVEKKSAGFAGTEILKGLMSRAPTKVSLSTMAKVSAVHPMDEYKAGIAQPQPGIGTNRAINLAEPLMVPVRTATPMAAMFAGTPIDDNCGACGILKSLNGDCGRCAFTGGIKEATERF